MTEIERKRPGVGILLIFPVVGIADCRAFPGVIDMVEAGGICQWTDDPVATITVQ